LTSSDKVRKLISMDTMTEQTTLWEVNVAELSRYVNPMRDDEWGCGVIDEMDVEFCEDPSMGRLPAGMTAEDSCSHEYNVARIAWLIQKGWDEDADDEPMTLACNYGLRSEPHFMDGNHRFAAAIASGKKTVKVVMLGSKKDLKFSMTQV
jgi:hypothetical protein